MYAAQPTATTTIPISVIGNPELSDPSSGGAIIEISANCFGPSLELKRFLDKL